ncbi:hypothetical protein HYX19_01325 [Candidatus Woesearchaeota archaeon]|nr:hypothetical protein [Candidatus Woesearchaeota archaeon]
MITKIRPDKQKSRSLKIMAEITLERLENTDREKYPTNTLTDYYDVIHKLMDALSMVNGIKIKGEGAHQELIDYVAKQYNFDEQTRQFLQRMRNYRNRISYEGFMVHKNYITSNQEKIKKIIKKLFDELD